MTKSSATIKVDTEANWAKAINYVPDKFTIVVFECEGEYPKVKIGDGVHNVNDLPFLTNKTVVDSTLIL